MMLTVLQPWEPAWLVSSGGDFRPSPSHCRCHRVSSRPSRFMVEDPWSQWRVQRPNRRTLDELLEQFLPSSPLFDVSQSLSGVLEDTRELRTSRYTEEAPCRAICATNRTMIGRELFKPLKWQLNDTKEEARAVMELPHGLRKSDDLNVELDEATRTITLTAKSVGGPDSCLVSTWAFSQRLDDSIDISQLQASVDLSKGTLQLKAPILEASDSTQRPISHSMPTRAQSGNEKQEIDSEEKQSPASNSEVICEDEGDLEEDTTIAQTIAAAVEKDQSPVSGPQPEKTTEIEDVGPDEDSDRISISSSGMTGSKS